MKKGNPFPTTSYLGPDYFCDRKEETNYLLRNLSNGLSTTVIAIRRMGKTALIHHAFGQLPESYLKIYLDILPTQNKNEFLNVLAASALNAVSEKSSTGKKIWNFIRSLRPVISFEPVSGFPQISFNSQAQESSHNIRSLLELLENIGAPVVIAIDEFQQITAYPEKNTDAWLRSIIQRFKNVRFVFAGSRRHLMTELFADPSRPFYRSTQILNFGTVPEKEYSEFINQHFTDNKRKIPGEIIQKILEWTNLHTYYVQLLCNRLYSGTGKTVHKKDLEQEMIKLLKEQEIVFYQYRELLTGPQWKLLRAIGLEGAVSTPTSMDFIGRHKLGSPATVLQSLNALIKKEMIYFEINKKGSKTYFIYDLLLRRWMENKYNRPAN